MNIARVVRFQNFEISTLSPPPSIGGFKKNAQVGSATRRIFLLENEADMRENRLATEVFIIIKY